MDLCHSLSRFLLEQSHMTYRQVVIEAGVFQIALICPSANVINQKYRTNGEVEEYSCIREDGQNLSQGLLQTRQHSFHTFTQSKKSLTSEKI